MLQDNLKAFRKKTNLSAKAFAELLNLPYTTYLGYENGGIWPTQENLMKIAAALHVSIDDLLGYDPGKSKQDEINEVYNELKRKGVLVDLNLGDDQKPIQIGLYVKGGGICFYSITLEEAIKYIKEINKELEKRNTKQFKDMFLLRVYADFILNEI